MVCVPLCESDYYLYQAGSPSFDMAIGGAYFDRGGGQNHLTVSLNATTKGAMLTVITYGTAFGLRVRRPFTGATGLDVLIDGVVYTIDGNIRTTHPDLTKPTDNWCNLILADGLPDGRHVVQVCFTGDPAGATQTWIVLRMLLPERAGYVAPPRGGHIVNMGTLAATAKTIDELATSGIHEAKAFEAITFVNTHTDVVRVTMKNVAQVIWDGTLPAAGTLGCSQSVPLYGGEKAANVNIVASVASVVNAAIHIKL